MLHLVKLLCKNSICIIKEKQLIISGHGNIEVYTRDLLVEQEKCDVEDMYIDLDLDIILKKYPYALNRFEVPTTSCFVEMKGEIFYCDQDCCKEYNTMDIEKQKKYRFDYIFNAVQKQQALRKKQRNYYRSQNFNDKINNDNYNKPNLVFRPRIFRLTSGIIKPLCILINSHQEKTLKSCNTYFPLVNSMEKLHEYLNKEISFLLLIKYSEDNNDDILFKLKEKYHVIYILTYDGILNHGEKPPYHFLYSYTYGGLTYHDREWFLKACDLCDFSIRCTKSFNLMKLLNMVFVITTKPLQYKPTNLFEIIDNRYCMTSKLDLVFPKFSDIKDVE